MWSVIIRLLRLQTFQEERPFADSANRSRSLSEDAGLSLHLPDEVNQKHATIIIRIPGELHILTMNAQHSTMLMKDYNLQQR